MVSQPPHAWQFRESELNVEGMKPYVDIKHLKGLIRLKELCGSLPAPLQNIAEAAGEPLGKLIE